MTSVSDAYRRALMRAIPKAWELPLRYWQKRIAGTLDFEMTILPAIVDPQRRSIDIGANVGIYSYALARLGSTVESFEPMDECASVIAAYGHPSIRVHKMALSDKKGVMTLRFPMANSRPLAGLATLENTAESTSTGTRQVDVRRLDDFEFTDVGFIKIDVEGHESSVIDGAIETVQTSRPVLLIEIEQRHHGDDPIEQIMSRICGLGYEGGFYWGGIFLPLGEFSPVIHQSGENLYTNKYAANFLFRPT